MAVNQENAKEANTKRKQQEAAITQANNQYEQEQQQPINNQEEINTEIQRQEMERKRMIEMAEYNARVKAFQENNQREQEQATANQEAINEKVEYQKREQERIAEVATYKMRMQKWENEISGRKNTTTSQSNIPQNQGHTYDPIACGNAQRDYQFEQGWKSRYANPFGKWAKALEACLQ